MQTKIWIVVFSFMSKFSELESVVWFQSIDIIICSSFKLHEIVLEQMISKKKHSNKGERLECSFSFLVCILYCPNHKTSDLILKFLMLDHESYWFLNFIKWHRPTLRKYYSIITNPTSHHKPIKIFIETSIFRCFA